MVKWFSIFCCTGRKIFGFEKKISRELRRCSVAGVWTSGSRITAGDSGRFKPDVSASRSSPLQASAARSGQSLGRLRHRTDFKLDANPTTDRSALRDDGHDELARGSGTPASGGRIQRILPTSGSSCSGCGCCTFLASGPASTQEPRQIQTRQQRKYDARSDEKWPGSHHQGHFSILSIFII